WIPGKVRRFQHSLKVPQIGWNQVQFQQKDQIFKKLRSFSYFYFVHSYFMEPETGDMVLGITDYGHEFASVVHRDNLWGVQFHPEKSQQAGLDLLRNFCTMESSS
ncbi:MAG: imidazole glycerol phosphate synthase subunit HisH, partial [bacterium]